MSSFEIQTILGLRNGAAVVCRTSPIAAPVRITVAVRPIIDAIAIRFEIVMNATFRLPFVVVLSVTVRLPDLRVAVARPSPASRDLQTR